MHSRLKGVTYSQLCVSNSTRKPVDSCRGKPSRKVCTLLRSFNIPDIIKLATYLQVSSATYRYFSSHSCGHLSMHLRFLTSLYIASKTSVKLIFKRTCGLLVKVAGLPCTSAGTWTFVIFVPRLFVSIVSIFPFFQQSVHMGAIKVNICSQKSVPGLYFLDSFSVSTEKWDFFFNAQHEETQQCIEVFTPLLASSEQLV